LPVQVRQGPLTKEYEMNNEQKLEQMIEVAKHVLKENPNDTWVAKGLVAMEEELKRMRGLSDDRRTQIG
jgi:cytochrome c-type biogenesis protein CcmH/NrfG